MSMTGVIGIFTICAVLVLLAGLALIRPLRRITSDQSPNYLKPLGIIGLMSGLVALILTAVVADTFGFPGSTEYQTYEVFNRSMTFILATQACALLAFLVGHHEKLASFGQSVLAVALAAWAAMAIGTGAEFWLYSDLPYGAINMRSASFSLFSIGSLIAGVSFLVLGLRIIRRRSLPWYVGALLTLYLPVDIILFVAGESIFVAPAIGAMLLAVLALGSNRLSDHPDSEPA